MGKGEIDYDKVTEIIIREISEMKNWALFHLKDQRNVLYDLCNSFDVIKDEIGIQEFLNWD